MRQKIVESGMAANRELGAIDWEIIPDVSTNDDPMDVDPHLDEWEDIFEEDMGPEGKAVARLQMIISFALSSPHLLFHHVTYGCTVGRSVVEQKARI